MKTIEIRDLLNKGTLFIEMPEHEITFDDLTFLDSETDGYTLLGKLDEIEEDESLLSAIDSAGIIFDYDTEDCPNQFCENGIIDVGYGEYLCCSLCEEVESRTFDRERTLIFVKK